MGLRQECAADWGWDWKGRLSIQHTMETQPMIGASQVWGLWLYPKYVRKTDLGVGVDSHCCKQKLNRFFLPK